MIYCYPICLIYSQIKNPDLIDYINRIGAVFYKKQH